MTTLTTETFDGVPGGMNLALPAQSIDDTECQYLQDGLVDHPGIVRRRGPVRKVVGLAELNYPATGLVLTLNPLGDDKKAALIGDATHGYFSVYSDDGTTKVDLDWPHVLPTRTDDLPYRIVDAKPAIFGGTMVGVSSEYDSNNVNQALGFWAGGNKANYSAASVTVARGSANVTAPSGFASVTPGMWLFANTNEGYTSALIGLVRSVNSDTSLTLAAVSPYNVTALPATLQALRGFAPKVLKGRLTTDTNIATITGGGTKFLSQGLNTGTWQIYRASDMAFVGKVLSVQSEFALTLTGNAAVALSDAAYVALRADSDYNLITTSNANKVGWLSAAYADRQWYANNGSQYEKTSRVWFSDANDPEAVDISSFDGDWLDITSSSTTNEPIRALCAVQNGLLVFKENETFIITGNSPASFAVRKLEDDGAISGMTVQPYAGGAIWSGREGIHHYDGLQVTNLSAPKLGDYYKSTIRTFDPTEFRQWSMVNRGHYFVFCESIAPTVAVVKGTTSTTPTAYTIVINMTSRAFSIATNVNIRGAVILPASVGRSVWYLVNGAEEGDAAVHGFVCEGEAIFTEEAVDTIVSDLISSTGILTTSLTLTTSPTLMTGGFTTITTPGAGPDFYLETKKFYAADPLRLKRFKQFTLEYLVQGGDINCDTVLGYNEIGATLSSSFPGTGYTWDTLRAAVGTWDGLSALFPTWEAVIGSIFLPRRIRFMKKSQAISFRLWQSNANISRLRLGPYGIFYKIQRVGRV